VKFRYLCIVLVFQITGGICLTQTNQTTVVEDFKPASTNQPGKQYPQVNSEGCVRASILAPQAQKVQLDLGGVKYDLTKDEKGVWIGDSRPQDEGFHYYQLNIDGAQVPDPGSMFFYGASRWGSGIEIPAMDQDFYSLKNVPHGDIRSKTYFSKVTGTWRNINIYAPPGYDKDINRSFPVLYIQHGGGEDESGWAAQGKTNIILDNLIAEGKAVPMLVVIPNGNVTKPGMSSPGYSEEAMAAFKEELLENVIPFIENNYRVKQDAAYRAIAGLSMGGGQAFYTGLRNLNIFANVGVFSSGLFGGIIQQSAQFNPESVIPGILTKPELFNSKLKVFYISVGEQDPRLESTKKLIQTFKSRGLKVEFASFPGSHEWQVWRKSLHDFVKKLFK
jgi:enterochelin esterase-like enzyme